MFGLSLGKLLVLAGLILIVWYGFKYVNRVEAVKNVRRREREQVPPTSARTAQAEDLVRCETCNSYVAAHSAAACGRADCPWGR
jgi:uncharacterized protein